jgi:hypothetical protein
MADIEVLKSNPGQQIRIRDCGACGKSHEGVEIKEFSKEHPPWTHWYACPDNSDPVLVTLLVTNSGQVHQVKDSVVQHLARAEMAGQYMVAIFYMEGGKQHLQRITWDFPTGEFNRSVDMLNTNLQDEIGPPPQEALTVAASPQPTISVFGTMDPQEPADDDNVIDGETKK